MAEKIDESGNAFGVVLCGFCVCGLLVVLRCLFCIVFCFVFV